MKELKECKLCPRQCGIDRTQKTGFCKAGTAPRLSRAALHFWEEPCISGSRGSGTVFFSGCNLKCVYCQNYEISQGKIGKEIEISRLAEIFLELQNQGAHNINLVSPTPYIPQIITAIDSIRNEIKIPFVYNTGGYETVEALEMLDGYIDIFLTDIKYKSQVLSKKYSGAEDYFDKAFAAAEKMIKICGKPAFDNDGIMNSGVIIRHLVLPGCRQDSIDILNELAKKLPLDSFVLSLMSQYTPDTALLRDFPEICRKVTTFEYSSVVDAAIELGLDTGYMQSRSSADKQYTPPFDLSGI